MQRSRRFGLSVLLGYQTLYSDLFAGKAAVFRLAQWKMRAEVICDVNGAKPAERLDFVAFGLLGGVLHLRI
jgi:hypothetical protein